MGGEEDPEDPEAGVPVNFSLSVRLEHLTWAWFTLTMITGGIALLLAENPHRFRGLDTIGKIVFIFDLLLFVVITALLVSRFFRHRKSFIASVQHPTESLFIPTFFLSISMLLSRMHVYGQRSMGSWLIVTSRVLFRIYVTITFVTAVLQYHLLFTGKPLTLQSMTPAWILPVFPVMLSGTIASTIAGSQPPHQAISIIIAGTTFQTLGFVISVFMFSNYVGRLMSNGLPSPSTRPAYIGMANAAIKVFPYSYVTDTAEVPTAQVLKVVATFLAISLRTLSLFSSASWRWRFPWNSDGRAFTLTWWSCVFPNTGFIIPMIEIVRAIDSQPILWMSSAATCVQIVVYLCVLFAHARAVYKQQILWPGKDEDHYS